MLNAEPIVKGLSSPNHDHQPEVHLLAVESISDLHAVSLEIEPPGTQVGPAPSSQSLRSEKQVVPGKEQKLCFPDSDCTEASCRQSCILFGFIVTIFIIIVLLILLILTLHVCVKLTTVVNAFSNRLDTQNHALQQLQDMGFQMWLHVNSSKA